MSSKHYLPTCTLLSAIVGWEAELEDKGKNSWDKDRLIGQHKERRNYNTANKPICSVSDAQCKCIHHLQRKHPDPDAGTPPDSGIPSYIQSTTSHGIEYPLG